MAKQGFLLDTTVIIDHLNGVQQASTFMLNNKKKAHLSVITRAETLVGIEPNNLVNTKLLLDFFPTFSITSEVADLAADLRKKYKWKLPDALQAALAMHHKLKLATRNSKDFDTKKHSFVTIPYSL